MQHTDQQAFLSNGAQRIKPVCPTSTTAVFRGVTLVNDTAERTVTRLLTTGKKRVTFLTENCVSIMSRDENYERALKSADAVLPSGPGLKLALGLNRTRMTSGLSSEEFCPVLIKRCAQLGLSVFLFGGRPGIAQAAASKLQNDNPALRIAGTRSDSASAANSANAVAEINASGADVLLVAMPTPRQDIWLRDHAAAMSPRLLLGVGRLFDHLSGSAVPEPRHVRLLRLGGVVDLVSQPTKRAIRSVIANALRLARNGLGLFKRIDTKRGLDLFVAGGSVIVLSPVLLAVAMAIKLDSKGPVFFTQTRVGKNGRPFQMKKFRSMHINAEERRAELLRTSDREGICFKSRNDPRITRVGRFLRRSSLDELPQILNVLRNEMSIVGPRPALPCEVDVYPKRALGRLAVKPGITGIWQVSGRAEIGFEQMIDMDLAYARHHCLALDLRVIAQTFHAVVSGRGAY